MATRIMDLEALLAFAHHALDRHGGEQDFVVEQLIPSIIEGIPVPGSLTLNVNGALGDDELDNRVFDAIVSHERVGGIAFNEVEGRFLPSLIRRAVPMLGRDPAVAFSSFNDVAVSEAQEVFAALEECGGNCSLFMVVSHDEAVMREFARFLSTTESLWCLNLVCGNDILCSRPLFDSICSALGQSPSISKLCFNGAMVSAIDLHHASATLAMVLVASLSLVDLVIFEANEPDSFSMDEICRNLTRTEAFKDMTLCYRRSRNGMDEKLRISRSMAPWKPLLSQDVPLNYWPSILVKANQWNRFDSHAPVDAILFLLREKSDVLLQNVKRRRIRKRKRHNIEG